MGPTAQGPRSQGQGPGLLTPGQPAAGSLQGATLHG